jgi:TolB-like protein/Tfp pilus assembly protein PilF
MESAKSGITRARMSFIAELKRRNVFRVGIAYVICAWVIAQVADLVLENIEAPDWVMQAIMLVLAIGLPMVLIFAWAFELTPEGIKREAEVDRTESITHLTGRKLDFAIIGLLAVAVVYFAVDKFVLEAEPEQTETTAESIAQEKSIAVLPFVNMSADADQEYFSDGITEEILNTLVAIEGLQVAGRTSSFTFKDRKDVDLKTIGQRLGVSNILEGSVRKAGNKVRITAQLITVENGFHLWSETYDRELADIFEIQEEIASAIGEALQVELGLNVAESLDRRRTDNPEAYQWFLRGEQLRRNGDATNLTLAGEAFQKAIELDPNYVQPYVGYALTRTGLIGWGSDHPVAELQQEAENALDVAAKLDPGNGRRFLALSGLYFTRNDWDASGSAIRKAYELSPEDPEVQLAWATGLAWTAGRFEEGVELVQDYLKREPLDLGQAASLAMWLARVGRFVEAEAELRRVIEIDPGYSQSYYFLSDLYHYHMGRVAESLPWRRKAFDLNPQGLNIVQELTGTSLDLGDDAAAEWWTQEAERISDRSYFTISAKYFLSRYRDDEQLAESLSRQLADLGQVNRGGWSYVTDLEWLRFLQVKDPDLAFRVYESLAPGLVATDPTVDPQSHAAAIGLAALYLQQGNEALANDLLNQSLAVIELISDQYYHPANTVIHILKGDTPQALKELRISIDSHWRWEWWMLEKDPTFEPLWNEPEFKIMMDEVRADMAAQLARVREMERNGELEPIPEVSATE